MLLDLENRLLRLSVRELAEFRMGPSASGASFGGRWRAETGVQWHNELRRQAEAASIAAEFEVAVSATVFHGGWQFEINGRIDQRISAPEAEVLREIKTVRRNLPCDPEELRRDYPDYFNQAAVYHCLLPRPEAAPERRTQLVFVDIDEGLSQTVDITDEAPSLYKRQLDNIVAFADVRLGASRRQRERQFSPAFNAYRPHQEETRDALTRAFNRSPLVLLQAPTGFGKTGVALEAALARLRDGLVERIIFLTGKSTGQVTATTHLQRMLGDNSFCWYFQMRNRAEHDPLQKFQQMPAPADLAQRWRELNLRPFELFEKATVPLEKVRSATEPHELPAYPLSRAILPYADVWIGDYNYVFSPRSNSVFLDQPGFSPDRTLLIVDEAHNLPSRMADGLSFNIRIDDLHAAEAALRFTSFPGTVPRALSELADCIEDEPVSDAFDPAALAAFHDCLNALTNRLVQMPPPPEEMDPGLLEMLWELVECRRVLADEQLTHHIWKISSNCLRIECLDVAPALGARLRQFGCVLLMSATLDPLESFLQNCGLSFREAQFVQAEAEWRAAAFQVAVDCRADTRFRARQKTHPLTAQTIAEWTHAHLDPVAVFFPSYAYAHDVREYLGALAPEVRVALPKRGQSLADQSAFIDEALLSAQALFLVVGSGFTEGIDALGGRVSGAIVVGPALPEVNAAQAARMQNPRYHSREEAFREVYQVPGMIRVNQALGRLVRTPDHRARVLLHCRRFAETEFQKLLAPEYQTNQYISSEQDLHNFFSR